MKWSWKHSLSAAAVVLLLAACGGGGPTPTTGAVQGTLTRTGNTGPASIQMASAPEEPAIAPGGFFVAFERGRPDFQLSTNDEGIALAAAEGFSFRADGGFTFKGVEFSQQRAYPTRSGLAFYKAPGLQRSLHRSAGSPAANSHCTAAPNPFMVNRQATKLPLASCIRR